MGNGTTAHYNDQQLHRWQWTTPLTIPPQMPNHDNLPSVTWSVSGGGSKTETDDSNGKIMYHASWTTGGSLGLAFRIWQDSNGINVTTPGPSIAGGYSVTQDIVGGVKQNTGAISAPVSQPSIPQTLFSSLGPPFRAGRFLILGPPIESIWTTGKWIFSHDPSLNGTLQQQTSMPIPGGGSGYAPPAFVTSSLTWVWRIVI